MKKTTMTQASTDGLHQQGKVWLVGAGPGAADLLTLRALRCIAEADVVVYDNLVSDEILEHVAQDVRRVYVGKASGRHTLAQEKINALLVELAGQGLNVVRLKGGDPFIFGRGGEEMEALVRNGIACEVVPGITAASGAAACTGIPLTHRDHAQTVVFCTGHLKDDTVDLDWAMLARPHQTVVVYMGLGTLEIICGRLMENGLPCTTPAAVIHAASTSAQRVVTGVLASLPEQVRQAKLNPPCLIMVGEVVALYGKNEPVSGAVAACAAGAQEEQRADGHMMCHTAACSSS